MASRLKYIRIIAAVAVFLLCLALAPPLAEAARSSTIDTSGRFRLEFGGVFGKGFNREYIGETVEDQEPVHLRGGGGAGYSATVGYGLSSAFDIDLSWASIASTNKDHFVEGYAEIEKKRVMATLKYKIPFKSSADFYSGQIKLGAGVGYYFDTSMTLYYTNQDTDAYSTYGVDYKPALGYHASAEFETIMPSDWSFTIGILVYQVDYEGESENYLGPDAYAWDYITDFEDIQGGGVDLLISLGKYFW